MGRVWDKGEVIKFWERPGLYSRLNKILVLCEITLCRYSCIGRVCALKVLSSFACLCCWYLTCKTYSHLHDKSVIENQCKSLKIMGKLLLSHIYFILFTWRNKYIQSGLWILSFQMIKGLTIRGMGYFTYLTHDSVWKISKISPYLPK